MVLSIGEILADVIFNGQTGEMTVYLGGAPFNVAVASKKSGAKTAFLGKVGNDAPGKFLLKKAKEFGLGDSVQVDKKRNTTLAFVSIDENGERDFAFFRGHTADYAIDFDLAQIEKNGKPSLVHLGSLMLNEPEGRDFAEKVCSYCETGGVAMSFDVNFRADLFDNEKQAFDFYAPYIKRADIVKFSEEELTAYTGKSVTDGLRTLNNKIAVVTLGKDGCLVKSRGKIFHAESEPIKPVDTTGAGDAFFGTFVGLIDQCGIDNVDNEKLRLIALQANKAGAQATLHKGAVTL